MKFQFNKLQISQAIEGIFSFNCDPNPPQKNKDLNWCRPDANKCNYFK